MTAIEEEPAERPVFVCLRRDQKDGSMIFLIAPKGVFCEAGNMF